MKKQEVSPTCIRPKELTQIYWADKLTILKDLKSEKNESRWNIEW
jgi:hypothetical protein